MIKKTFLLSLSLCATIYADEGKENYTLYCSACHGADGKGVANAAPPLFQSQWVTGPAERMTEVILHGLTGSIDLHGKKYDLVMPPQTTLSSQKVAAVANYVRNSWGNSGEKIDTAFVEKIREQTKDQVGMIEAKHLRQKYPFTHKPQKIKQLISESFRYTTNLGEIHQKLKPKAVEEENIGLISLGQAGREKRGFSGRWSGSLNAPSAGQYMFSIDIKNQAQLLINGKVVADYKNITEPTTTEVTLPQGEFKIELRYGHKAKTKFQFRLFWSGPDFDLKPLHIEKKREVPLSFKLVPSEERALIHKNFFNSSGNRMLAIGFANQVNILFSIDTLSMDSIWKGEFLDVGETWNGRARGKLAKPLGKEVIHVNKNNSFITDYKTTNKWNQKQAAKIDKQFKGYEFDKNGDPTLHYLVNGVHFKDHFSVSSDGKSIIRKLQSTEKQGSEQAISKRILPSGTQVSPTLFSTGSSLDVEVKAATNTPEKTADGIIIGFDSEPSEFTFNYHFR